VLDVELWGAFHEYDHGYVAAVQLVRQITLIPCCMPCLFTRDPQCRPAVALGNVDRPERDVFSPVCADHAGSSDFVVTEERLAEELNVEVVWAEEGEAIVEAAQQMLRTLQLRLPQNLRRLDDLLPDETAHVLANVVAQDADGTLWINPLARLVQPLPGTDVPIRLNDDGEHEVLPDGLTDFEGWQHRTDTHRFALPLQTIGQPQISERSEKPEAA
jgi:hypothetical protein